MIKTQALENTITKKRGYTNKDKDRKLTNFQLKIKNVTRKRYLMQRNQKIRLKLLMKRWNMEDDLDSTVIANKK